MISPYAGGPDTSIEDSPHIGVMFGTAIPKVGLSGIQAPILTMYLRDNNAAATCGSSRDRKIMRGCN